MGGLLTTEPAEDPDENLGEQEWTDTTWEAHPFMVRVHSNTGNCGGSIISTSGYGGKGVVLTAAHCVDDDASSVEVDVGRTKTRSGGKAYKASWWKMHEGYSPITFANDIALIYLKDAIDYRGASAVQVYPVGHPVHSGDTIKLLGYYGVEQPGADCTGCSDSNTLEYTWSKYVTETNCRKTWGDHLLPNNDMCVQDGDFLDGVTSICAGDSGSPAILDGRQVGLASRADTNCAPSNPAFYTNVTHFYDWIQTNCDDCLSSYASSYTSQYYGCGGIGNNAWWGCKGTEYTLSAPTNQYIKQLCIWNDDEIRAIQAQYSDGSWSSKSGPDKGSKECFDAGSRCFTSVQINAGAAVDSLQFTLSDLEQTPKYGGSGGSGPFHENSKVYGYCLSGMKFRAKKAVQKIQFTWSQADMDEVSQPFEISMQEAVGSADSIALLVLAIVLAVVAVASLIGCFWYRCTEKKKVALLKEANQHEEAIDMDVDLGARQ